MKLTPFRFAVLWLLLGLVCAVVVARTVRADEQLQPAVTPTPREIATTGYSVTRFVLLMDPEEPAMVIIDVKPLGANGLCALGSDRRCAKLTVTYSGPTAATMITQFSTINLATTSLQKRIIQRLQTDGYLPAGSVIGTPGFTPPSVTVTPTVTPVPTP